jgi:hypothetical protein
MRQHTDNSPSRSPVLFLAAASAVILALSCANPLQAKKNAPPPGSGSLVVSLPAAAAWISLIPGGQDGGSADAGKPAAAGRAFVRSTSYTVEVLDEAGTAVIPPASSASASEGTLSTVSVALPEGSGYTVRLSVYNAAASTVQPVVRGEAHDVHVTSGINTPLSITCLPVNPTGLTVDGAPVSVPITGAGEKWFSLACVGGEIYNIALAGSGEALALFDSEGDMIGTSSLYFEYVPAASGTVYVCALAQVSGGSATISVTRSMQEGDVDEPVALALNTPHTFRAGPTASAQNTSYYRFTTAAAGTYALDAACYCDAFLYSDPSFSTHIASVEYSSTGLLAPYLAPNSNYYLKIVNRSSGALSAIGLIADPATISADSSAEGSVSNPVPLALGSIRQAKVGGKPYNCDSYYKFTTGAGKDYRIRLSASITRISGIIYTDPGFTSNMYGLFTSDSQLVSKCVPLSPGTTYYVRVSHQGYPNNQTFELLVDSADAPEFTPLQADGAWTVGSIDAPGGTLWFEAEVVGGHSYTLSWDDSYEGSQTYSLDVMVNAFHEDRVSAYFTQRDSGYASGQIFYVPAGQTKAYIQVTDYYNYHTGNFAFKLQ